MVPFRSMVINPILYLIVLDVLYVPIKKTCMLHIHADDKPERISSDGMV